MNWPLRMIQEDGDDGDGQYLQADMMGLMGQMAAMGKLHGEKLVIRYQNQWP